MKNIFLLLFAIFLTTTSWAQDFTVNGTVKDGSINDVLPGVNVVVKNQTRGTTTDFDGNFTIDKLNVGDVLVVSYIGYTTKEIAIKDSNFITISLTEDVSALNEVVVIGYGTQTKKEITGAVTVIGAETIEQLKPTRIEQALQGQVAGVNITSQSGSPGSASNIRIRGVSTNGNNNPLILVDGNVIEDLSVVNPGDIESINVLKDATAGIYGVRAANGVILITTKTGKKSTPLQFSYDTYGGFQETTRRLPLLNATEYGVIKNEAAAANGEAIPYPNLALLGTGTDWQNEVFQKAPIFNHNLTISGGTEKSRYSFGSSVLTQDGIVGGSKANFTRYNTRLNFNTELLDGLNFKANLIYTGTLRKTLAEGGLGSVLFNALNISPILSATDADGSFTRALGHPIEVINPLAQLQNTFNRTKIDKISGVFGLDYSFLNNFKVTSNYQWNYSEVDYSAYFPISDFGNVGNNTVFDRTNAAYGVSNQFYRDYTFDAFIDYDKVFNEVHDLKITLGTSIFKTTADEYGGTYEGVTNTTLSDPSLETATVFNDSFVTRSNRLYDSRLLSYFARMQYNYKGKYLLSAVVRRDGSTAFGPDNKFGYFPSGSLGWVVSDEDFFKENNVLSFVKLRASYGVLGNDRIPGFGFVSLLSGEGTYVFDNELVFGQAVGRVSNPEIQWEEQTTLDIGLDAKLFNNTINITADYFNKQTDNLLLVVESSGILGTAAPGAGNPIANAGSVRNSGFEFAIGYETPYSENFRFGINYNFTYLENEVLSVENGIGYEQGGSFGIGQSGVSRMEAGLPIGYFYGLKTDGIFQNQAEIDAHPSQIGLGSEAAPGDIRFVDVNGDGSIDFDDSTNLGNPIPDFTMGLNVSFDYKNFDFQTYIFASIGNDIVRNYDRNNPITNQSVYALNRWTGEGSTNEYPRVTNGATSNILFSDFYVEDGSFVRAQNMQLGYSLNSEGIKDVGISKLRLYVSASNVFTFSKYKGFDPSASSGDPIGSGFDSGFYPVPRTYLLGLNLKF
ncbi:SusC/RagA family TonB-linked outer membrane protein [Cellulophaga sp. Ld12]|uniref:SusC/RagA family TonB-linked outer membrane protein n=1 Tax=Cellulophaga sp. Ld12 TaxID=3229535 RepID=UPI003867CA1B